MSTKKYLFITIPSFSHLAPLMPVAMRLREQGHTVAFASNNMLKDLVEGEGFQFFEIGAAGLSEEHLYQEAPEGEEGGLEALFGFELTHLLWEKLFIPLAETMTEDLLRLVPRFQPDAFLADATFYGAAIVSELTGVLWASYAPGVLMLDSLDLPPMGPGFPPPRTEQDRQMYQRWKSAPPSPSRSHVMEKLNWWNTALNNLRKKHGLPGRAKPTQDISDLLTISFVDPSFEFPRRDLPPQVHFVGPSLWSGPQGNGLPSALRPQGKPVILVTMGTVFYGFRRAWEICAEALKDLDAQVVVTTGRSNQSAPLRNWPDNFIVERFIPYRLILPITDLVICHAGFGTTMNALSHGVPLVCIPIAADNFETAQRVQESGAGLRLGRIMVGETTLDAMTADRLKAAILESLGNRSYKERAQWFRRSFERLDGPVEAANLMVELAETRRPALRRAEYWENNVAISEAIRIVE